MKILKKILAGICILVVSFGLFACDKTDSKQKTTAYTVTVTCSDASTLATISVYLKDSSGNVLGDGKRLDKNHTATFDLPPATYFVELSGLLDAFDVPEAILTPSTHSVTVNLTLKNSERPQDKKVVTYTVTLKLATGKPAVNKTVLLCATEEEGGACVPAQTNSSGVATYELEQGTYEVHIPQSEWPENSCFDDTKYKVTATKRDITVQFENAITYAVSVYYAKKGSYGMDVQDKPAADISVSLYLFNETTRTKAEVATGTLSTDAKGVASFKVPSGLYLVELDNVPANFSYQQGLLLESESPSITLLLIESGTSPQNPIPLKEGLTDITFASKSSDYWFIMDFQGKPGVYSVESLGSLDTYAKYYEGSAGSIVFNELKDEKIFKDDKTEEDKNFYLEISVAPSYMNENNMYVLNIGAENLPSDQQSRTFTIKVTFLREIKEIILENTYPQAKQIKSSFKDPLSGIAAAQNQTVVLTKKDTSYIYRLGNESGNAIAKIEWLNLDDEIVYNEADGYYHLNNADGAIIYVPVSGNIVFVRTFDKSLYDAYCEAAGFGFNFSDGLTYKHDYIQFLEAYNNSGNKDGLHPLTKELIDFLQTYAYHNHNTNLLYWPFGSNAEPNPKLYYFGCCYVTEVQ